MRVPKERDGEKTEVRNLRVYLVTAIALKQWGTPWVAVIDV